MAPPGYEAGQWAGIGASGVGVFGGTKWKSGIDSAMPSMQALTPKRGVLGNVKVTVERQHDRVKFSQHVFQPTILEYSHQVTCMLAFAPHLLSHRMRPQASYGWTPYGNFLDRRAPSDRFFSIGFSFDQ